MNALSAADFARVLPQLAEFNKENCTRGVYVIAEQLKKLTCATSDLATELLVIRVHIEELSRSPNRGDLMGSAKLKRIIQGLLPPTTVTPYKAQERQRSSGPQKSAPKASLKMTPPKATPPKTIPTLKLDIPVNQPKPVAKIVRPPLHVAGKRCPPELKFDHMCFVNSPIQALMYSPYVRQFLSIKEKERSQEVLKGQADNFLDWLLAIKKVWDLEDRDHLNTTVDKFKTWLQGKDSKRFSPNEGDSYEFLEIVLGEIGIIDSRNALQSKMCVMITLFSAYEESASCSLQELAQKDFNGIRFAENEEQSSIADMLILNYPLDYQSTLQRTGGVREFRNKQDLVFPQDDILTICQQKYQLTGFTCSAKIGHFFQCIYLDERWIKCDDDRIEVMTSDELREFKKTAYVLFFERIKQEVNPQ